MAKPPLLDKATEEEHLKKLEERERQEAEAVLAKVGPKPIQKVIDKLNEWQKLTFWAFDSLIGPEGRIPEHVVEEIFTRYPAFKKHLQKLIEEGEDVSGEFLEGFGIWGISKIRYEVPVKVYRAASYFWHRSQEGSLFMEWVLHGKRTSYGQEDKVIPDFKTWLREYEAWKSSPEAKEYLRKVEPHLIDIHSFTRSKNCLPAPMPFSIDPFKRNGLAPFASAFPAYGAAKAIFAARRGWPTDEEGKPRYVFEVDGPKMSGKVIYHILLPWDVTEEEVTVAHKELAWEILKSMGPDTAWLHMLLLAYAVDPSRKDDRNKPFCIPMEEIYHCLGLNKRSDLNKEEKARRALAEINKLRHLGLQITHLQWAGKKKLQQKGQKTEVDVFNWDRRLAHLWEIGIHEFGQMLLFPLKDDGGKTLLTHEEWQLVGREGLWGDIFLHGENSLRQFGYLARDMLTKIDRYHCPWGAALAVYLTFRGRFNPGTSLSVSNREIIEFAGGEENPTDPKKRYDIKLQVLNAIEEQYKWGLEPDYSQWPENLRPEGNPDKADNLEEAPWDACPEQRLPVGYWDAFLQCETIFRPTKGSQAEALTQANQQVKRLPETAISPMLLEQGKPKKKVWVGSDIKELREKLGLTQKQLATYLEVSPMLVSHFETGRRKPNAHQKQKLAQLAAGLQR